MHVRTNNVAAQPPVGRLAERQEWKSNVRHALEAVGLGGNGSAPIVIRKVGVDSGSGSIGGRSFSVLLTYGNVIWVAGRTVEVIGEGKILLNLQNPTGRGLISQAEARAYLLDGVEPKLASQGWTAKSR